MNEIIKKEECCGCYTCFNICPRNAIEMIEDEEGFKYPKINEEKCINCGMCKKVCPIINNKEREEVLNEPIVMAAWSKDNDIRLDSTSGGIFSELAYKILENNGYVSGAIYDENFMVKHIVTNKRELIEDIRSSKYLQSNINDNFKEVKKLLDIGETVLICGSPCQISGLYNFLGKNYQNLITCDFICRGMNSPKIFRKYLKYLEEKYKSKVVKVKFKNKIHGWHNFSTRVDFENGKKYIGGRYTDSYMVGYLKYNAFMRPSCYRCHFKDISKKSDITLADFWGIENINKNLDNDKGTSLVLLNTKKGEKFFKGLSDKIQYTEIKSKEVFRGNICMTKSVEETEARKKVFSNIDKMEYKQLSDNFFPEPKTMKKIKIYIRNKIRRVKTVSILKRKRS